jgi:DNA modification methylase
MRPQIVHIPVEDAVPYARNARTHSPAQIRQVANSIRAFGFINPIVIDQEGTIIAGHGRVLAAKELGLATVPAIRVEHLSEAELRAYRLADNKIPENAGWSTELLRIELEYLTQVDLDFDVDLTGFSTPEIDILLGPAEDEAVAEAPPPPLPLPDETITRPGDLWQLGPHRIISGDCRDASLIDRLMAGGSAGMVITDPPYNVPIEGHVCGLGKTKHDEFGMASGEMSPEAFTDFLTTSLGQLARASREGAVHFTFIDWRHLPELLAAGRSVYDSLLNLCVWAKTNGGMGSLYRSQHELVFVFRKGSDSHINNVQLGKHGRYRTNVWNYPGVNAFGTERDEALAMHPTVKPVRLVADAIMDVSKRGDIVLDGFLGSGTTILAAEQTGRVGYGVELDPRYVDVALRRWIEATGELPVHVETGRSFTELETVRVEQTSEVVTDGQR